MQGSNLRRFKRRILSTGTWKIRLVFWSGAILVGLVAAFFAESADYIHLLFTKLLSTSPYIPLVLTPLGLMLASWLTTRFFHGSSGSGIPQTIAALNIPRSSDRESLLSLRIAIGKTLLTLMGLGCGASIGREGPSVHIGASIMYVIGRYAHFPRHYLDRSLILAGGAAGLAAAFNTPLAGIVFAIEEMNNSFEERTNGTLLTAVIISGITAIAILGNYSYFGHSDASMKLSISWFAIIICGLTGGLLGGLFSASLIWSAQWISPFRTRHPLILSALCGLALAIIGLVTAGQTYGTGYQEASGFVSGAESADALFPYLKMAATTISYLTGIPGGIFAPSLATGAGLGNQLAMIFTDVPVTAIVLLGMVGYFSGVVQTPITSTIIIMEMTNNQDMLIPLMATAFLAFGTSRIVCPTPVYRALAKPFIEARMQNHSNKKEIT